jgi:tripartite ATP-independent transporter DctP family solute receptor
MKRRHLFALSALVAATFTLGAPTQAFAQKTILKLGWTTADSATDPYTVGAKAFKKAVEENSKGSIEVQLYPNRQLGEEKQVMEAVRFGTVDMTIMTNAVIAQIEPAYQVNDLPFLYSSEEQARKALDGKLGNDLSALLAKKNVIVLGYMEGGFRQMVNNKKPVSVPTDVTGVKYRVMQNPMYIDMFTSLGGAAVPMAWGEVFTAVQQGTIDGLEIPVAVIDSSKMYEVTKFLSMTNHTYSMIALLISKRSMDKLTAEQKTAVMAAAKTATAEQRAAALVNEKALLTGLAQKGMIINKVADVAPFRKSVQSIYDKSRVAVGDALINQALEAVK